MRISISSCIIFGIGDFLCQQMELRIVKKPGKLDIKRILKSCMFGIVVAPYLYFQLSVIVPRLFPGKNKLSVIKSVLYAISISDGIFNFSYFVFMSLASGKKIDSSLKSEIMEKYVPVQLFSMKIWFFLTGMNFFLIPIHFRVAFDNTLCTFWNMFLSYVEHNK